MVPEMRASLGNLPTELRAAIVKHAADHRTNNKDLRNLAFTSKLFYDLAIPHLFGSFRCGYRGDEAWTGCLIKFVWTLARKPSLMKYVHTIDIGSVGVQFEPTSNIEAIKDFWGEDAELLQTMMSDALSMSADAAPGREHNEGMLVPKQKLRIAKANDPVNCLLFLLFMARNNLKELTTSWRTLDQRVRRDEDGWSWIYEVADQKRKRLSAEDAEPVRPLFPELQSLTLGTVTPDAHWGDVLLNPKLQTIRYIPLEGWLYTWATEEWIEKIRPRCPAYDTVTTFIIANYNYRFRPISHVIRHLRHLKCLRVDAYSQDIPIFGPKADADPFGLAFHTKSLQELKLAIPDSYFQDHAPNPAGNIAQLPRHTGVPLCDFSALKNLVIPFSLLVETQSKSLILSPEYVQLAIPAQLESLTLLDDRRWIRKSILNIWQTDIAKFAPNLKHFTIGSEE